MKKSLVTLLIAALAVTTAALMSGCGSDTTSSDNTTPDTPPTKIQILRRSRQRYRILYPFLTAQAILVAVITAIIRRQTCAGR